MKFRPIQNYIIIKPTEMTTSSGIIIPDSAKEKPEMGEVIAVGEGKRIPDELRVGDRIVYTKYGPNEVTIEKQKLLIVDADDILAICEDNEKKQ